MRIVRLPTSARTHHESRRRCNVYQLHPAWERIAAHEAKMSALSAYCQYSRFGMGSNNDAGRDNRLCKVRHSHKDVTQGSRLQVRHVLDTDEPGRIKRQTNTTNTTSVALTFSTSPTAPSSWILHRHYPLRGGSPALLSHRQTVAGLDNDY